MREGHSVSGGAATLLVLMGLLVAGPTYGQQRMEARADTTVPRWVQTFGAQLRESLTAESPMIKRDALQHITYFAAFYGDHIDFSDAVPTLVRLYRQDDDADVRLFALVALYAIGDEQGMQQVRRAMYEQQWPPRLQFVTMAALVSHFGADTFAMDEFAARQAEDLMAYYTSPRVLVGPLEVVGEQQP